LANNGINLQLIGVPDQAEKDEVVKSVMDLKSAEIEEGYTMDAVGYRQVGASNCKCILGGKSILLACFVFIFILSSLGCFPGSFNGCER
jgi:hypothetical protein